MQYEYSETGSAITPFTLTAELHCDMGRLIRACAEIEDIVGLYLCRLAHIGEAESIVLLGRSSASAKLRMAATIANAVGGETKTLHDRCFENDGFRGVIKCRNTVAHGLMLGLNDEGRLSFVTLDAAGANETALSMTTISYDLRAFRECAEIAEASIPELERLLRLEAWRKTRRERPLLPHRKSQAKGKQGAKPQRPPKPSPA